MEISFKQIQGTFTSSSRTLVMVQIQNSTTLPIAIYLRVLHEPVQGWLWVAIRCVTVNNSPQMKQTGNVLITWRHIPVTIVAVEKE